MPVLDRHRLDILSLCYYEVERTRPVAWDFVLLILSIPMADKTQAKLKVAQQRLEAGDKSLSDTVVLGSHTSLSCSERWSTKQVYWYSCGFLFTFCRMNIVQIKIITTNENLRHFSSQI